MNSQNVIKLADERYRPKYDRFMKDPAVKEGVAKIVAEETKRGGAKIQVSRGVRTRISELLQSMTEVPNPPAEPTGDVPTMRRYIEEHREHQNAHFHALWQLADKLANEAGVQS